MNMTREIVLRDYLKNKWFKKTLIISHKKLDVFNSINSLHSIYVTGFLDTQSPKGCIFDAEHWPFDHNFFDLIILDNALYKHRDKLKQILGQIHFCLANDGELIISSSHGFFVADLVPKALASSFVITKIRLIYKAKNLIMKILTGFATKEFVVFFKKIKSFDLNLNPVLFMNEKTQVRIVSRVDTTTDCKDLNDK